MNLNTSIVPHLTTALQGPLQELETHLLAQQTQIEQWFRQQWQHCQVPFYASVDLRNAGFKLAPVDTNLFPAGFNNLNPAFLSLCVQAAQTAMERIAPNALRILIIPENHNRNQYYWESVAQLKTIFQIAGYEARIGSLDKNIVRPLDIPVKGEQVITVEPVLREGNKLGLKDFQPCLILLNNDLSGGHPEILEGLQQLIIPDLKLGWNTRLKSNHFSCYREVAQEFGQQIEIDPWLIDPLFKNCGEVDFMKKEGIECLMDNVDSLLAAIRRQYRRYQVDYPPFVIVKADAGSYGMGVMTVHNAEEIRSLNRKQRTKMNSTKEGQKVKKVIIQEGVYTFETWGPQQAVAEPVVYMIDRFVVGGFYRVHKARGINENLNAPGMYFEPLAFVTACCPETHQAPDAEPNRFYSYGVIARLALLAAARELS